MNEHPGTAPRRFSHRAGPCPPMLRTAEAPVESLPDAHPPRQKNHPTTAHPTLLVFRCSNMRSLLQVDGTDILERTAEVVYFHRLDQIISRSELSRPFFIVGMLGTAQHDYLQGSGK